MIYDIRIRGYEETINKQQYKNNDDEHRRASHQRSQRRRHTRRQKYSRNTKMQEPIIY